MSEKPLCVECGSKEVISKGISWYCKACGRWFLKKLRGKYPDRIKKEVLRACIKAFRTYEKENPSEKGKFTEYLFAQKYEPLKIAVMARYNISRESAFKLIMQAHGIEDEEQAREKRKNEYAYLFEP